MWTDDVALAADALEAAARYLREAADEGRIHERPQAAAVLIEQADGEIEESASFLGRARRAVQHG